MYISPSRGSLNGFLRSLGTEGRRRNIELYTSSNYFDYDVGKDWDPWEIFYFSSARWASSDTEVNPWIQVNLKNHYIVLKNYTIVTVEDEYSFKGWNLTASNDNFSSFQTLDSVPYYQQPSSYCSTLRDIKYSTSSPPAFNSFRFTLTKRPSKDNIMRVCSVEFFGRIFSSNKCTLSMKRKYCFLLTFLSVLIYSWKMVHIIGNQS